MHYYAQIDENNICVGVSQLASEINLDKMIKLDFYDLSVLGKKFVNGKWEDVETDPVSEPEITENEFIKAEILLNQAEIISKQKEHDEILAELLLGQQEWVK